MALPEEQEGESMPLGLDIGAVELEMIQPTPDFSVQDNSHDHQLRPDNIVLGENPEPESIGTSVVDASAGSVEDERRTHRAELASKHPINDSQLAGIGFKSQVHEGPGSLSPESERILKNASIAVSTLSPEVGGRYIVRNAPHEDILEEIKSAFKFVKNGPTKFSEKIAGKNLHQNSAVKPNSPLILRYGQVYSKNTPTLPVRLMENLSDEDLITNFNAHEDSGISMEEDCSNPMSNALESNAQCPVKFKTLQVSIPLQNSGEDGKQKQINISDELPNYQSIASPLNCGLRSRQIPLIGHLDGEAILENGTLSHPSCSLIVSDEKSRRSQPYQKATPNNRVRIKQPFPDVANAAIRYNNPGQTLGPNQNEKYNGGDLGQPSADAKYSISDNAPISPAPNCKDMSHNIHPAQSCGELQRGVSTSHHLSLRVAGRKIPPNGTLCASSNERSLGHPIINEDLSTNLNSILTDFGLEDSASEGVSALFRPAPLKQQNTEEDFTAGLKISKAHQHNLKDTNIVGDIAMAGASADCILADGRFSSSQNQVLMRPVSRQSSSHSLPQSNHTNGAISTVKDASDNCNHIQHTSQLPTTQSHLNPKMNVSETRHSYKRGSQRYSPHPLQEEKHFCKVVQAQEGLIKHNQEVEDILNHVEHQKEVIQFLQSELERLKASGVEKFEKVQALEREKVALKAKVKKFERLSVRYKDHMNEVVISQKNLFRESQRMQSVHTDMKIFQEAYITRETHIKRLECLLQEAKEFRAPAEKLLTAQRENEELIELVQETSKANQLLQSDLEKNIIELGRERHNASQFQRLFNAQLDAHKELAEHLRNTKSGIIEDLTNENGILAAILQCKNSTQEKIGEILTAVNVMKSYNEDSQPVLEGLVENLSIKVENIVQATENISGSVHESHLKHFADLKEKIDQIPLDKKSECQLNNLIAELRGSNVTLSSNLSSRKAECQDLTKRIDLLESELTNCRGQLSTKCDELAAALALPKEDPKLRERCYNLERENIFLQGQADGAAREVANIKEELATLRQTSLETERQRLLLEDRCNDAQKCLKNYDEEKQTYMSKAKFDIEKARQDVAKDSLAVKNELIIRHNAHAKNIQQRRAEAESQVKHMKEELQRMQDDRETYIDRTAQLHRELSVYREESNRQVEHIMQLEMQGISLEALAKQESSLECARGEIPELRTHLEHVQKETTTSLCDALQMLREIENHLRKVDGLERENKCLLDQNFTLQEQHNAWSTSTTPYTKIVHDQEPHDDRVAVRKPSVEMKLPINSGGSNQVDLASFQAIFTANHTILPCILHQTHEIQPNRAGLVDSVSFDTTALSRNPLVAKPKPDQSTAKPCQVTGSDTSTSNSLGGERDMPSLQLPSYKPLKVANRKAHGSKITESTWYPKKAAAYNLPNLEASHTSLTTQGTALKVPTPTEDIIPFSNFSPIRPQPTGSSIDISPIMNHIEAINNQEDLHSLSEAKRGNKQNCSRAKHTHLTKGHKVKRTSPHTLPNHTGVKYHLGYESPSNGSIGATKNSSEVILSVVGLQESNGSKRPLPPKTLTLKSVLKKPTTRIGVTKPDALQSVSNSPTLLKDVSSSRGINKSQRRAGPEPGYKRVASGHVIKSSNGGAPFDIGPHGEDNVYNGSSQYQRARLLSKQSSLMPGPKRNERKRAASSFLGDEGSQKPCKAPRTSLHFKSTLIVSPSVRIVPNSQETKNARSTVIN